MNKFITDEEKIFIAGTIDLKNKLISDKPDKQINDLIRLLTELKKEIEWWFDIYNNLSPLKNFKGSVYIKKPIVIGLYEFANGIVETYNKINRNVKEIGKIYKSANRENPCHLIDRINKENAEKIHAELKPFRRQLAAHIFTKGKAKYITLETYMHLVNDMKISKLEIYEKQLSAIYKIIVEWFSINKNQLVLLNSNK